MAKKTIDEIITHLKVATPEELVKFANPALIMQLAEDMHVKPYIIKAGFILAQNQARNIHPATLEIVEEKDNTPLLGDDLAPSS